MAKSICSVEGCDREGARRGMCFMHYQRWMKRGTTAPRVYPRVCTVDGCDAPCKAKGYCTRHHSRYLKAGDAGGADYRIMSPKLSIAQRVKAYGWTVTAGDCWEWDGPRHEYGYGILSNTHHDPSGPVRVRVHRWMYEQHVGPIPRGMVIRHTCDNPPCINPDHLLVGTQADNVHDMWERGRANSWGLKNK